MCSVIQIKSLSSTSPQTSNKGNFRAAALKMLKRPEEEKDQEYYWAMTLVKDLKMIEDPKVWGKSLTMK